MRYVNTDDNAAEEWRDLSIIVAPDLNWFANERWLRMKCFHEEIAPGFGKVSDAVWSYIRFYELVGFHDIVTQRERMLPQLISTRLDWLTCLHRAWRVHDCIRRDAC